MEDKLRKTDTAANSAYSILRQNLSSICWTSGLKNFKKMGVELRFRRLFLIEIFPLLRYSLDSIISLIVSYSNNK